MARRVIFVLLGAGVLWVAWTGVSLWLTFRDVERITVDVEEARDAIAALPQVDRPPPPPVEVEPEQVPTMTTLPPRDITGDQLPYDLAFSTSPAIPDEAFNAFLIIGSDTRAGLGGKRADVLILALLPEDGSAPILVSLPRDLWLRIPCWNSQNRINAALNGCGDAASGPELLAITVAEFTGIKTDHFTLFDFEDFKKVIDAFGGIEICVEVPTRFGTLEVPAGCTRVDGEEALSWVRSRKTTREFRDGRWRLKPGVNDLTRNERQREVLMQLLGNVKSLDTLLSLVNIVESIADAVTIDDGITIGRATELAWDMRSVSPGEIAQVTIPVRNHTTSGGAAVLLPTKPFAEVFAEFWPRPVEE